MHKFTLDKWSRFERFLILGTTEAKYSPAENFSVPDILLECAEDNPSRTASLIKDISYNGRAAKEQPLLLALAHFSSLGKNCAQETYRVLPDVLRTGTQIFTFMNYVAECRGFGSGMRKALAKLVSGNVNDVAFQIMKYQNREGFSWRDFLRIVRPDAATSAHAALFRHVVCGNLEAREVKGKGAKQAKSYPAEDFSLIPHQYLAAKEALHSDNVERVCSLIESHKLSHEMINNDLKKDKRIWEALVQHMPPKALLRNLSRFTNLGMIEKGSTVHTKVEQTFSNSELLRKSRLHPWDIFIARHVYKSGQGEGSSWAPDSNIVKILEGGFYASFGVQKPTGKRRLICLDVSGSMDGSRVMDSWDKKRKSMVSRYNVTAREASMIMALLSVKTDDTKVMAFSSNFVPVDVTSKDSLDSAVKKVNRLPFDSTNCALPMLWAKKNRIDVDSFEIYTDNETNYGPPPHQALRDYREATGIGAAMVVCGMSVTDFSVADPNDKNSLDVVGMDSNAPNIIRSFVG